MAGPAGKKQGRGSPEGQDTPKHLEETLRRSSPAPLQLRKPRVVDAATEQWGNTVRPESSAQRRQDPEHRSNLTSFEGSLPTSSEPSALLTMHHAGFEAGPRRFGRPFWIGVGILILGLASWGIIRLMRGKGIDHDPGIAAREASTCREAVRALNADPRLSVKVRVAAAECYGLKHEPAKIIRSLTPLINQIQRAGEMGLNKMHGERSLAMAYHRLATAYPLVEGAFRSEQGRDADDLTKGHCQKWAHSNTCVTKLEVLWQRRQVLPPEAQSLFRHQGETKRLGLLEGPFLARFWLLGARWAGLDLNLPLMRERFDLARQAAPPVATHLLKEMEELRAYAFYRYGDRAESLRTSSGALEVLRGAEEESLILLKVLRQVSQSSPAPKKLRKILADRGVMDAALFDHRIVHVVGIESLRLGLFKDFSAFLGRLRRDLGETAKDPRSFAMLHEIKTWDLRLGLAKRDDAGVIRQWSTAGHLAAQDPVMSHLLGLAYQGQTDPSSQKRAVEEFRKAHQIEANWQSQHALALALLRNGRGAEALSVIESLKRVANGGPIQDWTMTLRAEWQMRRGRTQEAQKVLASLIEKDKEFQAPRELLIDFYSRTNQGSALRTAREDLAALQKRTPWLRSTEALMAPQGPFARLDFMGR